MEMDIGKSHPNGYMEISWKWIHANRIENGYMEIS